MAVMNRGGICICENDKLSDAEGCCKYFVFAIKEDN